MTFTATTGATITFSLPENPPKLYDIYRKAFLAGLPREESLVGLRDVVVYSPGVTRPSDRYWRKLKRLAWRRGFQLWEVDSRWHWCYCFGGSVRDGAQVPEDRRWAWAYERMGAELKRRGSPHDAPGRHCFSCENTRVCPRCLHEGGVKHFDLYLGRGQENCYCQGTGRCGCRSNPKHWGR